MSAEPVAALTAAVLAASGFYDQRHHARHLRLPGVPGNAPFTATAGANTTISETIPGFAVSHARHSDDIDRARGVGQFAAMPRIHILGASGSGTTTLGAALAAAAGWPHEDSDTYFWVPTDPPFTTPRPRERRLDELLPRIAATPDWIFTGSSIGWAGPLEGLYDLVVYLRLDPAMRMTRLHARETERYGARIQPCGDMAAASQEFLAWAEAYDTAGPEQRSRALHEAWLAQRTCPVLRLDAAEPVAALTAAVLAASGFSFP